LIREHPEASAADAAHVEEWYAQTRYRVRLTETVQLVARGEPTNRSGVFTTTMGNSGPIGQVLLDWQSGSDKSFQRLRDLYVEFGFKPDIGEPGSLAHATFFSQLFVPGVDKQGHRRLFMVGRIGVVCAKWSTIPLNVRKSEHERLLKIRRLNLRYLARGSLSDAGTGCPVLRVWARDTTDGLAEADVLQARERPGRAAHDPAAPDMIATDETWGFLADRYGCSVDDLRNLETAMRRVYHDPTAVVDGDIVELVIRKDTGKDGIAYSDD
jgi:hypothetical protein